MTKKIRIRAALGALVAGLMPFIAFAQTDLPDIVSDISDFEDLICDVARWLFTFFVLLALVFILISAYRYLTSQGEPERVKGATRSLVFAVVAIIVAVLARGIPLIVTTFLGAKSFKIDC